MKSNLAYICFAVSCYFAVSTDVQSSMRTWNITEDCKPITIQCHTLYRNFSHEYAPPNNCTCFDADAICEGEKDVCVNGSKLCPPTKYPKIYVLEIVRNPLFGNFSSSATPYIISCTTAMEKHCPASAQHRLSCLQVNETIERVYLSRCSSACNNPLALISLNKTVCTGECYDSTEKETFRCPEVSGCFVTETRRCYNEKTCTGQWTRKKNESCSHSCGQGARRFMEVCTAGKKESYNCPGTGANFTQRYRSETCNPQPCPHWASWAKHGRCSKTCNDGSQEWTRQCMYLNAPSSLCSGISRRMEKCRERACPSIWGTWRTVQACNATFKEREGVIKRARYCYSGSEPSTCLGKSTETETELCDWCKIKNETSQCSIPCGSWSSWTENHCEADKDVQRRYCLKDWKPGAINPHCPSHDFVRSAAHQAPASCLCLSGLHISLACSAWGMVLLINFFLLVAVRRQRLKITSLLAELNMKLVSKEAGKAASQASDSADNAQESKHLYDYISNPHIHGESTTTLFVQGKKLKDSAESSPRYVTPNYLVQSSDTLKKDHRLHGILHIQAEGSKKIVVATCCQNIDPLHCSSSTEHGNSARTYDSFSSTESVTKASDESKVPETFYDTVPLEKEKDKRETATTPGNAEQKITLFSNVPNPLQEVASSNNVATQNAYDFVQLEETGYRTTEDCQQLNKTKIAAKSKVQLKAAGLQELVAQQETNKPVLSDDASNKQESKKKKKALLPPNLKK